MTNPGSILWPFDAPVLDQGQVGSCTGNAITQWLNTEYARGISKRTDYLVEKDAVELYTIATERDGDPGEYPKEDTGSTGDAACDAAVSLGYLAGYRNVHPTQEAIVATLVTQPLIVGTNWYDSMDNPDSTGLLTITGEVAGGHEYLMLGMDVSGCFVFLNSWTDTWGVKGRFRIKAADFITLLNGDQTAVTAPIAFDNS